MVHVDAEGGVPIAERILRVSRSLAEVDEIFSFFWPAGGAPKILGSASVLSEADERAGRYSREFYRFDPLFRMTPLAARSSLSRYVLGADDIAKSDYRDFCFDQPKLRQKISFEYRWAEGRILCNFYLRRPLGPDRLQELEEVAALSLPSLSRLAEAGAGRGKTLQDRIEAKLAAAYEDLTKRERQVCARTIAGWTADAIALDLGIGRGSVLTYRRRAYGRYGVSAAGEFLDRIVN